MFNSYPEAVTVTSLDFLNPEQGSFMFRMPTSFVTICVVIFCTYVNCWGALKVGRAEGKWDSAEPQRVVQPVHEYFTSFRAESEVVNGVKRDMNPMRYYTHLGTDYGPMGPAESGMTWKDGMVHVTTSDGEWGGMQHSLAGLAREVDRHLDFAACYPRFIRCCFQPRIVEVRVRVRGRGTVKVEAKSPENDVLWCDEVCVDDEEEWVPAAFPVDPVKLARVKSLNWIAEPGSQLSVDSIGLLVEYPEMSFAERVFLVSYAKLARCYLEQDGVVKDRANFPGGAFDTVPGSGLFCLATCAAWKMHVVDRDFAQETLRKVHRTIGQLPTAHGFLPHFIRKGESGYEPAGGAEFSSVDSSLYYLAMCCAAEMLSDETVLAELTNAVRSIEFDELTDDEGYILHGVRHDGSTLLTHSWRGWGGETALVLLLDRMARGDRAPLNMERTGRVWNGVGFIGSIQSIILPQFSRDRADAVSGVNWLEARRSLLKQQKDYFPRTAPDSEAARLGLYGLSAGEAFRGRGYTANGVEMENVDLIHPHYILMSAAIDPNPEGVYELLRTMESRGLIPPWGLAECLPCDLSEYHPYIGSLNASFECLGAYHLWAKVTGMEDEVYRAAEECPPLKEAMKAFYP